MDWTTSWAFGASLAAVLFALGWRSEDSRRRDAVSDRDFWLKMYRQASEEVHRLMMARLRDRYPQPTDTAQEDDSR